MAEEDNGHPASRECQPNFAPFLQARATDRSRRTPEDPPPADEWRPGTLLRIEGQERAEEIQVDVGEVHCTVAPARGSFTVRTPAGTVSVVGTELIVRVVDSEGEDPMLDRRMIVRVLVGAVLVSGTWGSFQLVAGEEKQVPKTEKKEEKKSGTIVGELTAKEDYIEVKADGEEKARRYVPPGRRRPRTAALRQGDAQDHRRSQDRQPREAEWSSRSGRVVKSPCQGGPARKGQGQVGRTVWLPTRADDQPPWLGGSSVPASGRRLIPAASDAVPIWRQT
jgi:hypothetical protein